MKYGGLAKGDVGTVMILVHYSVRVVIFRVPILGNFKASEVDCIHLYQGEGKGGVQSCILFSFRRSLMCKKYLLN